MRALLFAFGVGVGGSIVSGYYVFTAPEPPPETPAVMEYSRLLRECRDLRTQLGECRRLLEATTPKGE